MLGNLPVGSGLTINGFGGFSSITNGNPFISSPWGRADHRNRRLWGRVVAASLGAVNGQQDHYAVLGIRRSATSADIKRAYRLLARKYHPDVSKHLQAGEVFKTIRHAYEILSNEATRTQYDQELKFQEDDGRSYRGNRYYSHEYEAGVRINRWAEMRQKMRRERYWKHYDGNRESSSYHSKTNEEAEEGNAYQRRSSFREVLRSAFISLFLLQTFGSLLSLTFTSLMALLDKKLDAGYKVGYTIAWILGGRGGVLLTLCLSFASWLCGKTSSGMVVLVVVAVWFGSCLARYAPIPQGALLALLYMSIKLQGDF